MNISDNRVASLAEWLEIATEGIAAAGKERITREIEVHFYEAVDAGIAEGRQEEAAGEMALTALGNPRKARREFRRKHLTEADLRLIARLNKNADRKSNVSWGFFWGIFCIFIMFATPLHIHYEDYVIISAIFIGAIVSPGLAYWVMSNPRLQPKTQPLLLISSFRWTSWAIAGALVMGSRIESWIVCPTFFWLSLQFFLTWKKIRKTENPAIGT